MALDAIAVSYSTPSAAAVRDAVGRDYALGAIASCRLLHRGLNDGFLIEAERGRFVLRVYRAGWRTREAIGFELAALQHLERGGTAVAAPLRREDGTFIGALAAPEGERLAALFTWVPGDWIAPTREAAAHYGRAVAKMHVASGDFACTLSRPALDLEHLLRRPLVALRPWLGNRPRDRALLERMADRLERCLAGLPLDALDFGFCHGDLYEENALREGERVTLIDFDCCGFGWRAYDLAVYRWRYRDDPAGASLWSAFLDGYLGARPLGAADLAAVPLFVPLRAIWLRGLHCSEARDWGVAWLNERYWQNFFRQLSEWETALMGPSSRI